MASDNSPLPPGAATGLAQLLAPSLAHRGAVACDVESLDAAVASHFGDPLSEQRYADQECVVHDRSNREIIAVEGPDRLSWLNGFCSQELLTLPPFQWAQTLILDANGRVEHHAELVDDGSTIYLDTEPGTAQALLGFLQKMVFWAEVAVTTADFGILTLVGPSYERTLSSALADEASTGRPAPLTRARRWPASAVDLIVPASDLSRWWTALVNSGAHAAGMWSWEAQRVELQRPRLHIDTDAKTIPHEVGWIGDRNSGGAVHLEKGCYRGQETVARVHNLGKPPRMLVLLHLDGSTHDVGDLPAPGTEVTAGERTVGRAGTAITHHEQGPICLALLKRNIPADTNLEVAGIAAKIDPDSIPDLSAPQAGRAAVQKLRGQS